ncbi:MAG: archaetidylinositol phosphate synthase [archaeon YNP-LCB-003-016]|uniref:archaetidylinositol phosphate synthase n=1 Tax=Candidatus Culexarchaeum yellowstonense TaxID=2928963 RepID=UPI0026EF85CE|nr:archaetidylinositol phosphate synthase [Candidatus Culexarchaeum yellowstonense]MCR6691156.1 archaetidylinositol phosphate synthase [Candidatus Culexarchaeum yellowstonense]
MLDRLRAFLNGFLHPLASLMIRLHISPNMLTLLALLLAVCSSIQILYGNHVYGGLLILASGFFDVMDGFVARMTGSASSLGEFLDSVFDRFSDALIFSSIILSGMCDLISGLLVLVGGFMISYIRCKGELLGIRLAGVGLAERSERLIIISAGLIFGVVQLSIYLLSVLVIITVAERFYRVVRFLHGGLG